MSEGGDGDDDQKTEEPTARRLEDARKKGQVVNSKEVSNWVVLFASALILLTAGPGVMVSIRETLKIFLEQSHAIPSDAYGLGGVMRMLFFKIGGDIVLPLLAIASAGAISGFAQTGPLLTTEPLKPDFSKVSVIKGFGRLFSMKSVVELVKGLIKLTIVSVAGIMVLLPYFDGAEHFIGEDIMQSLFDLRTLYLKAMIAILSVFSVVAAIDYMYQRHDYMKKMRMSKQEMKEEFRQSEGDPVVKGKLRQLREAKARQRMMQSVPTADVVITNPTHFAVALKYNSAEMQAPIMVAKGADQVAARIKEIAKENKVPVIENPPLARALFEGMEIDQVIPQENFKAVAEVISYVFRLKGKRL